MILVSTFCIVMSAADFWSKNRKQNDCWRSKTRSKHKKVQTHAYLFGHSPQEKLNYFSYTQWKNNNNKTKTKNTEWHTRARTRTQNTLVPRVIFYFHSVTAQHRAGTSKPGESHDGWHTTQRVKPGTGLLYILPSGQTGKKLSFKIVPESALRQNE